MGVLKARVGADWVPVTQGGLLLPGGVAGQVLVKNSATDGDALWKGGPWTAFAPQLDVAGGGLNLGSGPSMTGAYSQIGYTVNYRMDITVGAGTIAAGSGQYTINVPVTPAIQQILGFGWMYGVAGFVLVFVDGGALTGNRIIMCKDGGYLGSAQGFTQSGHVLRLNGSYQAAAAA